MKKTILILSLLLVASTIKISTGGLAQEKPLLMRQPAMSRTQIVFSYAGDLWIAPRGGGEASRLTTGVGNETSPQFSPDGTTVAFTGEYDGNVDLYTVPASGGVPKRMTYHPGFDALAGWTPDGKQLLFFSQRASDSGRFARLFTMPVDGVFPAEVPLPMGWAGSFSPDGTKLAYEPLPRSFNAWKRYRGGTASPIWIASLSDSSVEKLPRADSNDFNPMWVGDKVYFLSDRNGPITLFAYDTKTKKVAQLIQNNGLDIKSASAGPDGIVYEQFGSLNIYDLKSGKSSKVNVTINGDMLSLRPKYEKVGTRILGAAISPTGARAVFEARGDIISVPAEKGDARNLTNTTGVAEYNPTWSPDSKKIAYSDKRLNHWYVDIEKGQPVKVDTLSRGFSLATSWSPDSRWLTYAKPLKSWYNAVFVYSLEDGKSTQITDGLSDALSPVFDKSGKYIYFTASTDIGPRVFGFDMSSYPHRPTRSVYVAVLKKTDPSPLAPESDEEKVAEEKPSEKKDGATEGESGGAGEGEKKADVAQAPAGAPKPADKKEPPKVTIDFDNISQRILALPPPNRNYVGLAAGKANTLFIIEVPDGAQGATLHKFDLEKRKFDKALDNIDSFELSANGEKMLYRQQQNWFIAATATLGTPAFKPGEGKIKTEEMELYVSPRAEWDQMYRETWRIERDFFYAPNYHGLDLQATAKKYEPYLASLAHRADLNYLFQEMLGELTVGHLYVSGGDVPDAKRVPVGLLGADYKIENGRYRFARVFNGENWNPQLRAPLTQPGVNVAATEYLLAVNGRNLGSSDNIFSFFEATANKQ